MLTIQGEDSLGISQEKFLILYAYLRRSDNFSGDEVGQWGLGKASYTCLSDTMLLETKSREDGSCFAMLGKGGIGFSLLPRPRIETFGTKVTLVLRESVDLLDLCGSMLKYTRFSGIKTTIVVTGEIAGHFSNRTPGTVVTGQTDPMEYLKASENEGTIFFSDTIDDEDFTLWLIGLRSERYVSERLRSIHLLVNVPIDAELSLPGRYVLKIKDERKYKPTADRERLTDAAINALQDRVLSAMREKYPWLNTTTVAEYRKLTYTQRQAFRDLFGDHLHSMGLDSASRFAQLLKTNVRTPADRNTRHDRWGTSLSDVLESGEPFFAAKLEKRLEDALREHVPNAVLISVNANENAGAIIRGMLPDAKEYLKKIGVKLSKQEIPVVVHTAGEGTTNWGSTPCIRRQTVAPSSFKGTVVKVPGGIDKYFPILSKVKTTYGLAVDRGDIDSGYMLSDFVEKLRDSRILTTDGWKTIGQMMKARKKLTVIIYDRQDIARCVRDKIPGGKVYAFLTPDRAFELFVCMKFAGKEIRVLDGENELCDIRDREYRWIHWRPEPEDSIRRMSVLHVENSGQPDYIVKMFRAYAAVTDYDATKSNEEVTAMRDAILGPEKAAH